MTKEFISEFEMNMILHRWNSPILPGKPYASLKKYVFLEDKSTKNRVYRYHIYTEHKDGWKVVNKEPVSMYLKYKNGEKFPEPSKDEFCILL